MLEKIAAFQTNPCVKYPAESDPTQPNAMQPVKWIQPVFNCVSQVSAWSETYPSIRHYDRTVWTVIVSEIWAHSKHRAIMESWTATTRSCIHIDIQFGDDKTDETLSSLYIRVSYYIRDRVDSAPRTLSISSPSSIAAAASRHPQWTIIHAARRAGMTLYIKRAHAVGGQSAWLIVNRKSGRPETQFSVTTRSHRSIGRVSSMYTRRISSYCKSACVKGFIATKSRIGYGILVTKRTVTSRECSAIR